MEASSAPGPVNAGAHIDPSIQQPVPPPPDPSGRGPAMSQARAQGPPRGSVSETAEPVAAIFLTEVQSLGRKLDVMGKSILALNYLVALGMCVGIYLILRPAAIAVRDRIENAVESAVDTEENADGEE